MARMTADPTPARTELSLSGWGDPAHASPLPESLHALLRQSLGVSGGPPAPSSAQGLTLTTARLPAVVAGQLAAIVGDSHARSDQETRARHAGGKSTVDLLALRSGPVISAPDLVLFPGSHAEVQAILELSSAQRVAVVPFGGGTSVVGGLTPEADAFAGVVAVDLRRLNALEAVDDTARLAVLGPGLRGPEAEALLAAHGYTLGHFPQSFEYATLGGFAAARSSGQASAGYGRFEDHVMALRVATPAGALDLGRAPRSAAGPDLRQLMLGSEGALGVITQLTLSVAPAPAERVYEGWMLPSFDTGTAVLRALAQDGPAATVVRLSDPAETALGLAQPTELEAASGDGSPSPAPAGGCLAIVGWEGETEEVADRRRHTARRLTAAGATAVAGAGDSWLAGRYRAPYLRDALLDAGALVETLETAAFWSALPAVYAGVTGALQAALAGQGTPPVVLAHISHVYPAGASLYFTVACAQSDDPIAQWRAAKRAAADAILAAGATITHHHGVGRDHREPYGREIGAVGIELLRAAKRAIDPQGILNPGILVP